MKVKDVIDSVNYKNWTVELASFYQSQDLNQIEIDFDNDINKDFNNFTDHLKSLFKSGVRRATAKKILNNAYILEVVKVKP